MTKWVTGFTSIAPDQGIKQENRTLNVIGGIVVITKHEKALGIDSFEMQTQRPTSLLLQSQSYSSCKTRNTVKGLVA